MTWPAGWSVRFEPIELIDANGDVFAHEGDQLVAAGGLDHHDVFALADIRKLQ